MTRRKVWQGFLDRLRSVGREVSASRDAMNPAGASTDRIAPVALNGGGGALNGGGGALTRDLAETMFADEATQEIDEVELLEFLAADHDPVPVDPAFREQLRDRLWALIQEGVITRPKDH